MGVDYLLEIKKRELSQFETSDMTNEVIARGKRSHCRWKLYFNSKQCAKSYGVDVSEPAQNAQEAIQFIYFALLGATKEHNGVTNSWGEQLLL